MLLLAALLLVSVLGEVSDEQAVQLFTNFKNDFSVNYQDPAEEAFRFGVFTQNLAIVDRLNADNPHAVFGVTKFADRTDEEFSSSLGYPRTGDPDDNSTDTIITDNRSLPINFDWRAKGIVTPVKNQQKCGSCWAHAAAEAVESYWAKKTGNLVEVSVQQIVDCNRKSGQQGCSGGFPGPAMTYAHTQGLVSSSLYPYTGTRGTCKLHTKAQIVASVGGWNHVRSNEEHMRKILYEYSPMPVCVDATIWKYYQGGIITGKCLQNPLIPYNHAVLLVGWGTDAQTGIPYWLIRNSWDSNWGEAGYIRLKRGDNKCNIAKRPYVACGCASCKKC